MIITLIFCITIGSTLLFSFSANAVSGDPDDDSTFDSDLYVADMLTTENHPNSVAYECLMFKINQESPATILARCIKNDHELMIDMEAWKALTYKPSDEADQVVKEEDYYEGIIISALKLWTSSSYVKTWLDNKQIKDSKELFKIFKTVLETDYGIEFVGDLSADAIAAINICRFCKSW